ncbi:MAG: squalene synthase HpnC [Deltaproteobacteria bacterium]|nr:squalene synthase HpnC [Deltaproteobacteria bacterium]
MNTEFTKEANYPIDEVLQKKVWHLEDSYKYCERLARMHYENFPVGSVLIPKKLRPHVWAVYAFARRADDIADEDFFEADRIPALNAWEGLLEQSLQGRVKHPVFIALKETMRQFELPLQLFKDLLTAFKMDVNIKRHPDFSHLLYYCHHSANPVGRLILLLFGYQDEKLMLLSDKICTALQLANFWQDVAVDLKKGRIYIPQEDFLMFNYSEMELLNKTFNPNFQKLMDFEISRTEQMFQEGSELVQYLKGRLRWEIKCIVLGGMTILKKIREFNFDTLTKRPTIRKNDKISILSKSIIGFRKAMKTKFSQQNSASLSQTNPGGEL